MSILDLVLKYATGGSVGVASSVPEFNGTSSVAVAALLIAMFLVLRNRAKA